VGAVEDGTGGENGNLFSELAPTTSRPSIFHLRHLTSGDEGFRAGTQNKSVVVNNPPNIRQME